MNEKSNEINFADSVPTYRKAPPVKGAAPQVTRKSKMAGPRTRGKIEMKFTERSFPTPVRESRKPEEDEWLQKQAKERFFSFTFWKICIFKFLFKKIL